MASFWSRLRWACGSDREQQDEREGTHVRGHQSRRKWRVQSTVPIEGKCERQGFGECTCKR